MCQQREITFICFNIVSLHARHLICKCSVTKSVYCGIMCNIISNKTVFTIMQCCELLCTKCVCIIQLTNDYKYLTILNQYLMNISMKLFLMVNLNMHFQAVL